MIIINIEKIMKEQKRSKYWLCNQMNITMHNLNKIIYGKTKLISFKYMEQFCKYLNCTPGDLFTVEFDEEEEELY